MPKQNVPKTKGLTAARLAAAVTLATSVEASDFDELLERFRRAYQTVLEVTAGDGGETPEIVVRLPYIDAPEIPEPPTPSPPRYERDEAG